MIANLCKERLFKPFLNAAQPQIVARQVGNAKALAAQAT